MIFKTILHLLLFLHFYLWLAFFVWVLLSLLSLLFVLFCVCVCVCLFLKTFSFLICFYSYRTFAASGLFDTFPDGLASKVLITRAVWYSRGGMGNEGRIGRCSATHKHIQDSLSYWFLLHFFGLVPFGLIWFSCLLTFKVLHSFSEKEKKHLLIHVSFLPSFLFFLSFFVSFITPVHRDQCQHGVCVQRVPPRRAVGHVARPRPRRPRTRRGRLRRQDHTRGRTPHHTRRSPRIRISLLLSLLLSLSLSLSLSLALSRSLFALSFSFSFFLSFGLSAFSFCLSCISSVLADCCCCPYCLTPLFPFLFFSFSF